MGKSIHDNVYDAALNYIKTYGNLLSVCSAEPTTYTQGITTYMLATHVLSTLDYTGPANGDVSGRKISIGEQTEIEILNTGTGNHVAILDSSNLRLLHVTTMTARSLLDGELITLESFDIEMKDPR